MLNFLVPLGIGVGGALFNALARPGQTELRERDFDYDATGQAQARYNELRDPSYGAAQFERMAGRASQGAASLMRLTASQGGSMGAARAQAEAQEQRARAEAFDAFGQFRLQTEGLANQALEMDLQRQRFVREGMAQQRFQNANASSGFWNQVMGLAGTYATMRPGRAANAAPNYGTPQMAAPTTTALQPLGRVGLAPMAAPHGVTPRDWQMPMPWSGLF